MALHTATFPRFRQAPRPQETDVLRPSEGSTPARVVAMHRLNEMTSDAKLRFHVTSLIVVGMAALVAVLAVI